MGEFRDSGDSQPPSLVRRPDGHRDDTAIAAMVSDCLGKTLTAAQARYLITSKLAPLGILGAGLA
jgi:hypothetical protein